MGTTTIAGQGSGVGIRPSNGISTIVAAVDSHPRSLELELVASHCAITGRRSPIDRRPFGDCAKKMGKEKERGGWEGEGNFGFSTCYGPEALGQ